VRDPNLPDFAVTVSEVSPDAAASANGRYVVFTSSSPALVRGDTNGFSDDVFLRDRRTDETTLISVNANGVQGDFTSWEATISWDGRYIAYASFATNLVPNDTNGEEANGSSFSPHISGDGRFILYQSIATNLIPGDPSTRGGLFLYDRVSRKTTRVTDVDAPIGSLSLSCDGRIAAFSVEEEPMTVVMAYDRITKQTRLISRGVDGSPQNGEIDDAHVSGDGRFIAFNSFATNLIANDFVDEEYDVFVHDLRTGVTSRVSRAPGGTQSNGSSFSGGLSADGRYISYESFASNLVRDDTNNAEDIFVFDRLTGKTTRDSISSTGEQADSPSFAPSLTPDGRKVIFESDAQNFRTDGSFGLGVFLHER
jgi:Tol biopolymer transport system component